MRQGCPRHAPLWCRHTNTPLVRSVAISVQVGALSRRRRHPGPPVCTSNADLHTPTQASARPLLVSHTSRHIPLGVVPSRLLVFSRRAHAANRPCAAFGACRLFRRCVLPKSNTRLLNNILPGLRARKQRTSLSVARSNSQGRTASASMADERFIPTKAILGFGM